MEMIGVALAVLACRGRSTGSTCSWRWPAGLVVGACAPLIGDVPRAEAAVAAGRRHRPRGVRRRGRRAARSRSGRSGRRWSSPWPARSSIEWLRRRGAATGDLALALFFYSGIAGRRRADQQLAASVNVERAHLPVRLDPHRRARRTSCGRRRARRRDRRDASPCSWRALFAIVLDEEAARVAGLPVDALNLGARRAHRGHRRGRHARRRRAAGGRADGAAGGLEPPARPVVPRHADDLGRSSASPSVVVGLVAARRWALAPGGTIVLAATAIFAVTAVARGRRRSVFAQR